MSAVRDLGRDGDLSLSGNTHAKVANDAFGYTLGYFAGDYNPIGTFTTASKFEASTAGSDLLAARSDIWNGNISHMVTCLPKASDYAANQTITPEAFGSAYKYDQLNRLSSSRAFTNINTTTNQWQSGAGTNPSAYATDYTYDAMGNILTQKRNGGGTSATALDELTYNYHTITDGLVSNRLYQVNDVVSAGNYSDDIDDQGTFNNTHSTIETANNYGYDELGNLVRDAQEEIASIEWTVYGKMKKITRNSGSSKADLEFGYDASGNRLWKKVTPKGSGAVISTYYYLRDAQGNEMCRYVKYTNTTSQLMYVAEEHSIYGSSRVGVDNRKDTLYLGAVYTPTWGGVGTSRRALGLKSFELSNHLGNVLVTVSDKPIYKVSSTTIFFQPEVTSISDYYPFGAPIHGRGYASEGYRFGFNGKEIDDETQTQDYGMRIYDWGLGRFLSVDPLAAKYPWQSPYVSMDNNPILKNDLTGQSGEVAINKQSKTITISANLIFYGEAATPELAKQTAADVQKLWNGANGKVNIDGVEYSVQFDITSEYRNAEGPIDATAFFFEKGLNDDVKNNYIEVKNKVDEGVSNMVMGGNEGTFQLNNISREGSTTEAHEFGHSLGLWPGTKDGHPEDLDLRGEGQPGIMYPRGTLVDPQYQYNPNAKARSAGGTLNPEKRRVTQGDINALGIDKLTFDKNGKSNLGKSTSSW